MTAFSMDAVQQDELPNPPTHRFDDFLRRSYPVAQERQMRLEIALDGMHETRRREDPVDRLMEGIGSGYPFVAP